MEELSDKELLIQFRNEATRHQAFTLLMKKYQKQVYWHIRRIVIVHDDADDVVQNVFVKVWKSLENFKEESQLFTWLYRIATNESLTFLKQKKASLHVEYESVEQYLSNTMADSTYFKGEDIQLKLQQAILTLPEKQRLVFNMKYFEELQYDEMSKILETSVGALKASYHHAVKKVEEFIKATVN